MEEGALSGRKGTGLFWSKNNEREREREVMGGGAGGEVYQGLFPRSTTAEFS